MALVMILIKSPGYIQKVVKPSVQFRLSGGPVLAGVNTDFKTV
jgi:hypothetical protein